MGVIWTNKSIITGPSNKTVLTGPTKTKPNLFFIVEELQEWPVILLIDPLEYVVTHIYIENFVGSIINVYTI